jgi:two-component system sensor histidine kinase AgrC
MIDLIRSLVTLIFAISMMYTLLECKTKLKEKVFLITLYSFIIILFDGFILIRFGYSNFMKFYPLLVHLPVFFAFVLISKFNLIKVLFIQLTTVTISTSFPLIALLISYLFGSHKNIFYIVSFMLYVPVWAFIYIYVRPSFLYMLNNTNKGWVLFCIIPLSYSSLLYKISKYNTYAIEMPSNFINALLFFILTTASYVLILRLFKQTREQFHQLNEHNLLQMQVATAQAHLENLRESHETTIIYRHDMRHHLNLIDAYLSDDNKEAAQLYIKQIGENIDSTIHSKYCNNYSVNLILSSYITKALNEKIIIETNIDLEENNAVSDMDLCIVFANTIENAINACKRINNVNDRIIKIFCKTKNDQLFIQISNSCDGNVTFINEMPMSEEKNHGLGTKSIAAIAKKYGGVYSFSINEGIFNASVIFQSTN